LHARFADREDGVNYYPTAMPMPGGWSGTAFSVKKSRDSPPTALPASGMTGWLRTFRRGVLDSLPEPLRDTVVEETAALVAPALRDEEGNWVADYVGCASSPRCEAQRLKNMRPPTPISVKAKMRRSQTSVCMRAHGAK